MWENQEETLNWRDPLDNGTTCLHEADAVVYLLLVAITLDVKLVQFYIAKPTKYKEIREFQNRVGDMIHADRALIDARGPDYESADENALFYIDRVNTTLVKVIECLKEKEKPKSKKRKRAENDDDESVEPLNERDVAQMVDNLVAWI